MLQADVVPLTNLNADPNRGPRTVEQWISLSAFRRLDAAAEAGRFGNAGRNIARAPGQGTLDLSVFKCWNLGEQVRTQLRHRWTASATWDFGRIVEAGSPRVFQAALKILF